MHCHHELRARKREDRFPREHCRIHLKKISKRAIDLIITQRKEQKSSAQESRRNHLRTVDEELVLLDYQEEEEVALFLFSFAACLAVLPDYALLCMSINRIILFPLHFPPLTFNRHDHPFLHHRKRSVFLSACLLHQ